MQSSNQARSKTRGGRLKSNLHSIDALKRAIELCGGKRSVLAKRLNVTWQTIELWLHGKSCITAERAMSIEYVTGGKVTRRELRPDLWAPMEKYYDEVDEG